MLVMIIAAVIYGTQTMQHAASAMQTEKDTANDEFLEAQNQCYKQEKKLAQRTEETRELRQFLETWTPIINRYQSSQDGELELMKTIRNNSLLTLAQKLEVRENKTNTLVPKSLLASFTVQDDYAKTMNWLGEIERKIPIARVTNCRLKKGDAGGRVNLEVHFEIPFINLQASFVEAKKSPTEPAPKS
jgi:hypothetical protein